VKARGVMDSNSQTTTTALGGVFKHSPETRREFLMGLPTSGPSVAPAGSRAKPVLAVGSRSRATPRRLGKALWWARPMDSAQLRPRANRADLPAFARWSTEPPALVLADEYEDVL
jgi:hypothetical protein